jgi:hypothetical protein
MKKLGFVYIALLLIGLAPSTAPAANIYLSDWAFNIDGGVISAGLGSAVPEGAFDATTGLGTWTITIGPDADDHYVIGFFDQDIYNNDDSGSYFDEYGSTAPLDALGAGQSWEIDEPEFFFGNIKTNFEAGALDNTNGVSVGSEDDVSMAMGWNFVLGANEEAIVQFHLSDSLPTAAFYLEQADPDSQASIYFWSELDIREVGVIPEPSTIILVFSGLGLAAAARFRKIV